uniref:ATP synthase complex subunit 8 n=1 Tax=Melitaea cinxia TaxID=113334 RepID=I1SL71_MELCN|nr:ATP synthase F0 subunit 8 [Melitaea cinxia]
MPQMMPINWFFFFFLFICIFLIFKIMNFYIFNYKYLKINNNTKKKTFKNLNWKW